jgi:UDP-N-acetylglucosamine acyltransferase
MPDISRQAIIESTAEIADGVKIGPFCYIGPHVRIDAGCVIENNVTIVGKTVLEERNHVFPLAVIGTAEGDAKSNGECRIGPNNVIREHATICAGHGTCTKVGADNLIMIGCQVGAGCQIGDHGIFANCTQFGEGSFVEDYVRTSGFCMIDPGVTVGAYTFVAAFAGVDRDAPPYAMVQGLPFRVRGVNSQNLKRCGFGEEDIQALKQAFHEIYSGENGAPDEEALRRIANSPDANPQILRLLETLRPKEGEGR